MRTSFRPIPAKDLYGKPGFTFLHEGGTAGMARSLQNMLPEDFIKNLNISLYHNNAQKQHISQPTQPTPQPKPTKINVEQPAPTKITQPAPAITKPAPYPTVQT